MSATSNVDATGTGGAIALITRVVGPTNPNTGGTTAQFHPSPTIVAEPTLPSCP